MNNPLQNKSYQFAIKIIQTYDHLTKEQKEYIISKQLLRSGTSVGANIQEAIGSVSRKDFINKLSISYKEARETKYWLMLLRDTNKIPKNYSETLLNKIEELLRILYASIKKSKQKT